MQHVKPRSLAKKWTEKSPDITPLNLVKWSVFKTLQNKNVILQMVQLFNNYQYVTYESSFFFEIILLKSCLSLTFKILHTYSNF